ncbi:MAG: hypothetical protein R6V83_13920 [Candidatus Thorarchaeota archaeon]
MSNPLDDTSRQLITVAAILGFPFISRELNAENVHGPRIVDWQPRRDDRGEDQIFDL